VSLVEVMSGADLWIGEMRAVRVGARRLVLLRTERGVHAYVDRCPHLGVPLSAGRLAQGTLTCSAHHYQFDADTGQGKNPKNMRLESARVECRAGKISIDDGEANVGAATPESVESDVVGPACLAAGRREDS
jgi:toluene monooxygenase system ferredoxin subunit